MKKLEHTNRHVLNNDDYHTLMDLTLMMTIGYSSKNNKNNKIEKNNQQAKFLFTEWNFFEFDLSMRIIISVVSVVASYTILFLRKGVFITRYVWSRSVNLR